MWTSTRLLFLSLLTVAATPGAIILVDPSPGISATSVVDEITGADMAGLIVIVRYNLPGGVGTFSAPWIKTGPVSGMTSASGLLNIPWSLSLSGPTNGNQAWIFQSNFLSTLLCLELDGTAAGIFFDRAQPNPGTPGSGPGSDLVTSPLLPFGNQFGVVTYSDAVSVGGQPPQGDLYAKLKLDFSTVVSSGLPGLIPQDFTFTQDTDRSAVPEPDQATLVCAALLSFALIRFRTFPKRRTRRDGVDC